MPYASTADLPPAVKDHLPPEAQRVFLRVFNEQKKAGQADERAFQVAWTAVKNGWRKTGDAWVRKDGEAFDAYVAVAKVDPDRRLVGGWVSIVHDGTNPVVDSQDDVIDLEDLRKAVHEFVKVRVGKAMHAGDQVAELVELVIVDGDLRTALGAPEGPTGAWAVWKVHDDDTWQRVKSGEFAGFSIGGRGRRLPL